MNQPPGRLFVVTAPSGAGKSTLVARLLAALPDLEFSVSWTTRPPRPGEVDGVAYRFTSPDGFQRNIDAHGFLEWAKVHGHLYGTARRETLQILTAGRDLVLDIDVQGAAQVRACSLAAEFIFILPPSRDVLAARLESRGTEEAAALARRLANAAAEVRRWNEFDYLIVNDDLGRAAEDLIAVVRAARVRRERQAPRAARVAATFPDEEGG